MSSTLTTEQRVIDLLARMLNRPAAELSADKQIVRDLGVDSVDLLGLVAGVEEEFDIVLPADGNQVASIRTIGELVCLVEDFQVQY